LYVNYDIKNIRKNMFKVGNRVVCIDNINEKLHSKVLHLTNRKTYIVKKMGLYSISVINDEDEECVYSNKRFITLKEYRKLKLEVINAR
jgi:hypothetical protein